VDPDERELLVARIASGTVRLDLPSGPLVLRAPTRDQRYRAAEVYRDNLRAAGLAGLFDRADLLDYLLAQGLWDEDRERLFEFLPKEIEEKKVALYQAVFKANERKVLREALAVAKARHAEVCAERSAFDHVTAAGAAAMARARYLLAARLHDPRGRPVFPAADDGGVDPALLDEATAAYGAARLDDAAYRELARTEPWRSTWATHKAEGTVFGVAPVDYTDEQRALAMWSGLYEGVYQHSECPSDEAIEDDDLFDGWMILQQRARADRQRAGAGDDKLSDKVRDADEVYLVADSPEDARRVHDKNDQFGKALFRQRMGHLKAKGRVNELDMPDTAQRLRMEMARLGVEAAK
jgi:hypothetical protein